MQRNNPDRLIQSCSLLTIATLRDYLKEKAKFLSPPTEGESDSSTDVNGLEARLLSEHWKPVAAWRDDQMVDSLLKMLDDFLGDRQLPVALSRLDKRFQPEIDENGTVGDWNLTNNSEFRARILVHNGALIALECIMGYLGQPVTRHENTKPPNPEFQSLVDYAIFTSEDKKILLETKSPSVLEHALTKLNQTRSFRVFLRPDRPSNEKVINKICLHMASHEVQWAAVSSHNKWVYFQLHPDLNGNEPYITYSTEEKQADNTRPFRAFLAMMIATAFNCEVESNVDRTAPLPPITEEDNDPDVPHPPEVDPKEDKSGSYKGSRKGTRNEPPATHSGRTWQGPTESPDLLIGWSQHKVQNPEWLAFYKVDKTDRCLPLGSGTVRFCLQRGIGAGSTGPVYEAKLDTDGRSETLGSPFFAVKVVIKCRSSEKNGNVDRLHNEYKVYCRIEQARQNGKIGGFVTPRCYGLYESNSMLALIMDCEGEALMEKDWKVLSYPDKCQIFELISALHKIGIARSDFEPRNIVRSTAGSYKIIDFSLASFHRCPGIKEVSWYKDHRKDQDECAELKDMSKQLGVEQRFLNGIAQAGTC